MDRETSADESVMSPMVVQQARQDVPLTLERVATACCQHEAEKNHSLPTSESS